MKARGIESGGPGGKQKTQIGRRGEEIALRFLRKKRYKILERGFRFLRGEIDIIARDRETLVFIEVKTRTGDLYGRPEESVTLAKQNQIRKLAVGYLSGRRMDSSGCRFDVISVRIAGDRKPHVEHFKDAF